MLNSSHNQSPENTGETEFQAMADQILGYLSTAVLLLDENGHILFSNQAVENLLGESAAHMGGQSLAGVILNAEELQQSVVDAVATNQLITRRQMALMLSSGGTVTADVTVTPVSEAGRVLIEFIPMDRYLRIDKDAAIKEHHDVTRQMVKGFAHEVKNPLGGIKGSAQLLARELEQESLHEYTNIIIEETDRLTSLVDRMLGPPTVCPTCRSPNIHEVLERACENSSNWNRLRNLTVIRDYDPSIPELRLDPEMMLQAVLNVVRNAMQILAGTPHPTISLVTRIERQFTIAGRRHKVVLRIDVNDNGPGIPEDIQEHLFYPMITRRPGGTGLGLTFAQSIINQHNGMIEFESEAGNTTFRISYLWS